MLESIGRFLSAPFTHRLPLLAALLILSALLEVVFTFNIHTPVLTAYIVLDNLLFAWLLLLPLSLLGKRAGAVYSWVVTVFYALWSAIDVFCMLKYNTQFKEQYSEIILQSNPAEMKEFAGVYLTYDIFLSVAALWGLAAMVYFIVKKYASVSSNAAKATCIALIVAAIASIAYRPDHIYETPIGKTYRFKYPYIPDLHDYLTHPEVTLTGEQPAKIVVIIGESFTKTHSSLYGYDKPTNPRLGKLAADSSLIVFTDVTSAATQTLDCFKLFMSLNPGDLSEDAEWYKYTTLPELLHQAGYYLRWASNQGDKSRYDLIPSRYAALCDTVLYKTDSPLYHEVTTYDEVLLPLAKAFEADTTTRSVDFYHLMGSHNDYTLRYPADRAKFGIEDYPPRHESVNHIHSIYDNSVLYNDSIVNEIISTYSDDECIAVYFSDHGLDMFDVDGYHGHGRPEVAGSIEAASRIPMMVYVSERYRQKFPDKVERLRSIAGKSFNTVDFPYFLMDIANIKLTHHPHYEASEKTNP